MKKGFCMIMILLMISCNQNTETLDKNTQMGKQTSKNQISEDIVKIQISEDAAKIVKGIVRPQKKEACDYVLNKDISEILGWKEEDIFRGGALTSASFEEADRLCQKSLKQESISIRLAWESDRQVKDQELEKMYKEFLLKGEKHRNTHLVYEEISTIDSIQTIFACGTYKLEVMDKLIEQQVYLLRKRWGNRIEVQIELHYGVKNKQNVFDKIVLLLEKVLEPV